MADIKYYDVILKPVVTEQSMAGMSTKKYTFLVNPEVTKTQVKDAVEKMFEGVKVASMGHTVTAELVASVLSVSVELGDRVEPGDELLVLDSMKMEIPVLTEVAGVISDIVVKAGDTVRDGDPLVVIKRG